MAAVYSYLLARDGDGTDKLLAAAGETFLSTLIWGKAEPPNIPPPATVANPGEEESSGDRLGEEARSSPNKIVSLSLDRFVGLVLPLLERLVEVLAVEPGGVL